VQNTGKKLFQSVLVARSSYRLTWLCGPPPSSIDLSMYNSGLGDYLDLQICYPSNSTFNVSSWNWDQTSNAIISQTDMQSSRSLENLKAYNTEQYFWNETTSLLYVRIVNPWKATGFNYCSSSGCHFITILADTTLSGQTLCTTL